MKYNVKTIGATELRTNLDEIIDQVNAGQEIIVTHRFKQPVRLQPAGPITGTKQRQPLSGLAIFDSADKQPSRYDPETPLKELYRQSIRAKYDQ